MNFQQEVAKLAVQSLCGQNGHEVMAQFGIRLTGLPDLTVDDVERFAELTITFGVFQSLVNHDKLEKCYMRLQEERSRRCILYDLVRAGACDELIQKFYPEYSHKTWITKLRKRHGIDLQRGTPRPIEAADAVTIEAWLKDNDCDPDTMTADQWLELARAMNMPLRSLWRYFNDSGC